MRLAATLFGVLLFLVTQAAGDLASDPRSRTLVADTQLEKEWFLFGSEPSRYVSFMVLLEHVFIVKTDISNPAVRLPGTYYSRL